MPDHSFFSNLIWQIADLLRGPYRPPQYERVMLPMTVLRRFDCVLAPTKEKVLVEFEKRKGGKLEGGALDVNLNKAAGQRFHNHSQLDFEKLKGDPDNIEKHLVSYIKGFSKNVRDIFDFFEFEAEIERMREANLLYLVVSKFCDVDLHPSTVPNRCACSTATRGKPTAIFCGTPPTRHTLRHGLKCNGRTLHAARWTFTHSFDARGDLEARPGAAR